MSGRGPVHARGGAAVQRFHHIVLFNAPNATEKNDARYGSLVADLSTIPGVVVATGGRLSRTTGAHTHALVVHFVDEAAYQAYRPHPAHRQLVEWFAAMSETVVADFTALRHAAGLA